MLFSRVAPAFVPSLASSIALPPLNLLTDEQRASPVAAGIIRIGCPPDSFEWSLPALDPDRAFPPPMDPLAHTLAGATLAETRLKDFTPLSGPALILGANAPDIDVFTMFMDRDLSLWFRRGWTHGLLAMVVLPVALTLLLLLVDRIIARLRGRDPSARAAPLLGLSALAVISHPLLDWLNTYGVRLLMPFDGRWFYGDALFIIDPWIWLLLGTSVVLAHSASRVGASAWVALGAATSLLVTSFEGAALLVRLLWCFGVVAIIGLRIDGRWQRRIPRIANLALVATVLYIAAMVATSQLAERQVIAWLAERGATPVQVMAGPAPGNPFRRDIVVADDLNYHFLELDWLSAESIRFTHPSIERGREGPVTRAALAAPHVKGLNNWKRFPAYRVQPTENGYRVSISDVRFTRRAGSGLGAAVVDLDRDLRVVAR